MRRSPRHWTSWRCPKRAVPPPTSAHANRPRTSPPPASSTRPLNRLSTCWNIMACNGSDPLAPTDLRAWWVSPSSPPTWSVSDASSATRKELLSNASTAAAPPSLSRAFTANRQPESVSSGAEALFLSPIRSTQVIWYGILGRFAPKNFNFPEKNRTCTLGICKKKGFLTDTIYNFA